MARERGLHGPTNDERPEQEAEAPVICRAMMLLILPMPPTKWAQPPRPFVSKRRRAPVLQLEFNATRPPAMLVEQHRTASLSPTANFIWVRTWSPATPMPRAGCMDSHCIQERITQLAPLAYRCRASHFGARVALPCLCRYFQTSEGVHSTPKPSEQFLLPKHYHQRQVGL